MTPSPTGHEGWFVVSGAALDHPTLLALPVISKDNGRTWHCMEVWRGEGDPPPDDGSTDRVPGPPNEPHARMVEIPSDLFRQVEIVGSTARNLTGRILFDPPTAS